MIRIRPYKRSDLDKILTWAEDEDAYYKWTAGVLGTYPITREQFEKMTDYMCFVAVDEDEPVGFFTARNPDGDLSVLRFGFVLVAAGHRGKGVGRAMLRSGLDYAFKIYGADKVRLVVFDDNQPACSCYRSIGFKESGKVEIYRIHGRDHRALEMEIACPAPR